MPRGMEPGFQVLSYYIRQKPICQALFAVFSQIATHSANPAMMPQNTVVIVNTIL